jgi:hypothetical protein
LQAIKNNNSDFFHVNNNNNHNNNSSKTMRRATPFAFALMSVRSPYTKEHYKGKLQEFFGFVGLPGDSLDEQGSAFLAQAKAENNNNSNSISTSGGTSGTSNSNNDYWAEDTILSFLDHQKQRVEKGELAASTLQTFYAPIRAFCAVHQRDLPFIDWKGISKTLPESPTYSNDRAPTREEIQKVIQYPNRMMKPLILVMCSSGIRVGAWDYLKWKHVIPMYNDNLKPSSSLSKVLLAV